PVYAIFVSILFSRSPGTPLFLSHILSPLLRVGPSPIDAPSWARGFAPGQIQPVDLFHQDFTPAPGPRIKVSSIAERHLPKPCSVEVTPSPPRDSRGASR